MLNASREAQVSVLVVSPSLSQNWKDALGDRADEAYVDEGAERFLDNLLRAAVLLAMTRAIERAKRWAADGHPYKQKLVAGSDSLFDALEKHAALPVWRWWRDGACGQSHGKPFILDRAGEIALATVCGLIADNALRRHFFSSDGLMV